MRSRFLSLTGFLVAAGLLAGIAAGQSVADVAKKNKEQNKDKKSRVVITDATLKSGDKDAAPAGEGEAKKAPAAGRDGAAGAAAERAKAQDKVDQEYRDKYRKMVQDLQKMEASQAEAEKRYAWSSAASWQRKAKAQRKKIDDLKEEARKAGVQPGVFRQVDKELHR